MTRAALGIAIDRNRYLWLICRRRVAIAAMWKEKVLSLAA
jgi:hypothetical protein